MKTEMAKSATTGERLLEGPPAFGPGLDAASEPAIVRGLPSSKQNDKKRPSGPEGTVSIQVLRVYQSECLRVLWKCGSPWWIGDLTQMSVRPLLGTQKIENQREGVGAHHNKNCFERVRGHVRHGNDRKHT